MKILQLNVEKDRHRDAVLDLIKKEDPDLLFLQEVIDGDDLPSFVERFSAEGIYVPMLLDDFGRKQGVALFSKYPIGNVSVEYYAKQYEELRNDMHKANKGDYHHALITAIVVINEVEYKVCVTHFPVNYPGLEVSEFQRTCYEKLRTMLAEKGDVVFCADLNCPRGTEIFDDIAVEFKDNIPKEIETTIDGNLHRAGYLPYVVDCIFTKGKYEASNVRLISNVSDHLAVLADITVKA
jgi:endonuclease/exonuclease/phosphatase family metal-dependent hydrolase